MLVARWVLGSRHTVSTPPKICQPQIKHRHVALISAYPIEFVARPPTGRRNAQRTPLGS
jgi:hypothetical protein